MRIDKLFASAREAPRLVYAEPYEQDGVTVIPATRVIGGGGGGMGRDHAGRRADGGGLGLVALPAGAFVIRDGDVRWVPSANPRGLLAAVAGVVLTALVVRGRRGP